VGAGAPFATGDRLDRLTVWVLVAVVCLMISAATLTPAAPWAAAKNRLWCVLCDAGSAPDAFGNTLLFLPFGFVLSCLPFGALRTLAAAAGFSLAVESTQFLIPGRDPNLGDLLFNTAGSGFGWLLAQSPPGTVLASMMVRVGRMVVFPSEGFQPWLTLGAGATVGGVILATCLLMTPDFPEGPYVADGSTLDTTSGPLHLGGNPRDHDFYQGSIDDVRIFSRARTAAEIDADLRAAAGDTATDASPTSGLIAAYDFEDISGNRVRDVSGHGHDGSFTQGGRADGKSGGGFHFSGSAENIVTVPAAAELNLAHDMTIEAWVFPTTLQRNWGNVVHKDRDAYFLSAGSDDGPLRSAGGGSFGGQVESVRASTVLPVNAWSHLAVTYDGATLVLYVNGRTVVSERRWSSARLLEASVGGIRLDAGGNDDDTLRTNLIAGAAVALRLQDIGPPAALAPVIRIRDRWQRRVLSIGTEATDFVIRSRVRATDFGLMSPAFRVPFSMSERSAGETTVEVAHGRRGFCVQVDARRSCGLGPGIPSGWALFAESAAVPRWLDFLWSAAWVAVLFLVAGFCAYGVTAMLGSASLLAISVVVGPWLGRTSSMSPLFVTIAVVAFVAGWRCQLSRLAVADASRHGLGS